MAPMLLRVTLLVACALAVTASPAAAQTTVTYVPAVGPSQGQPPIASEILIHGDPTVATDADNLDIAQSAAGYTITRRGGNIVATNTAGSPAPTCTPTTPGAQVTCDGPVPSFSIDLGQGDDTLTTLNV